MLPLFPIALPIGAPFSLLTLFIGVLRSSNYEYGTDYTNPYLPTYIDHNCSDFDTQKDAQLFFEANGSPYDDPHDLDRNGDGMACNWNP